MLLDPFPCNTSGSYCPFLELKNNCTHEPVDQSSRDETPKNSERMAGLQLGARYAAEGSVKGK